ncbi:hypothetical protein [Effusibacillus consociatus]|uniref:Uncharacterized protein n=1 Tax=Effusibacillus consociatus TaxID=1117041 RepID=A0ABV9PZT0_9BACL
MSEQEPLYQLKRILKLAEKTIFYTSVLIVVGSIFLIAIKSLA